METRLRSLAKAVSWQCLGFLVMAILGFVFTGSLSSGGALAAISSVLGFVSYLLHERVWASVRWGWTAAAGAEGAAVRVRRDAAAAH
ncbi:DUF2061 domain-containing protein [Aurantimonas sp. VKM B-3413]|uniref:DUF2061 domain-containing protein n=1 Tax=Aurantimonas sp. VKM B-3413 TaxID=2779401 RepID=UPI001E34EEAF|nr:DUF2061 domain-containing protein [Aurantimonas sp. VKM B-3413]MCB8838004.1 DUF2061 domain-containing protein [Aurantimonas sp. VKM B-3413]